MKAILILTLIAKIAVIVLKADIFQRKVLSNALRQKDIPSKKTHFFPRKEYFLRMKTNFKEVLEEVKAKAEAEKPKPKVKVKKKQSDLELLKSLRYR